MANKRGILMLKLGSLVGIPDWLVVGHKGACAFVELKTATGRISHAQHKQLVNLSARGFQSVVARSPGDFKTVLDYLSAPG